MAPNDYSCYIWINNETDVDFGLVDQTVSSGHYPDGNPPNIVEAHGRQRIHLKDNKGPEGTEGSVVYQFFLEKYPDLTITFTLMFTDPYGPWYDNSLTGYTNFPNLISVNVQPYQSNGHPFTASVNIKALGGSMASAETEAQLDVMVDAMKKDKQIQEETEGTSSVVAPSADGRAHANFDIGFEVGGAISAKKPVHETVAIAAFIQSRLKASFPPGTNYNNLSAKQWEFCRGIIWNDDPSCLLFDDDPNDNHNFGVGWDWYKEFKWGEDNCMTRRSHFGNLQFLHAMATQKGESAQTTKNNIMAWLEVMYKLACGNQDVSPSDQLKTKLPHLFNDGTSPTGNATFQDLIIATTGSYKRASVQNRALGTILHVIQDSFAVGHTRRHLLNPRDMNRDGDGFVYFRQGTYGHFGSIIAFHTYSGQDDDRHAHYDSPNGDLPTPKHLDSFNNILGARDAIAACTKLLNYFAAKTKWEDDVKNFFDTEVFALDPKAQPSDAEVDKFPFDEYLTSSVHTSTINTDAEYAAGMQRKLGFLEAGSTDGYSPLSSAGRNQMLRQRLKMALIHLGIAMFVTSVLLIVFRVFAVRR